MSPAQYGLPSKRGDVLLLARGYWYPPKEGSNQGSLAGPLSDRMATFHFLHAKYVREMNKFIKTHLFSIWPSWLSISAPDQWIFVYPLASNLAQCNAQSDLIEPGLFQTDIIAKFDTIKTRICDCHLSATLRHDHGDNQMGHGDSPHLILKINR